MKLLFLLHAWLVSSKAVYSQVNKKSCIGVTRRGGGKACANGEYQGTFPYSPDSTTKLPSDMCEDISKPVCPNDEISRFMFDFGSENYVQKLGTLTEGSEVCYQSPGIQYNWNFFTYNFQCCQCPEGYYIEYPNCQYTDEPAEWKKSRCVKCDKRSEWLVRDPAQHMLAVCKTFGAECKDSNWIFEYIAEKEDHTSRPGDPHFQPDWFDGGEEHGAGKHTIGYGHNCLAHGDCDAITAPINAEQAKNLYNHDIAEVVGEVAKLPNIDLLNENQFAALLDLGYNSGAGAPAKYFYSKMFNQKFSEIADAFPTTAVSDKSGRVFEDLKARRLAAQALWNTPTDKMSGCKPTLPWSDKGPMLPVLGPDGKPLPRPSPDPVPWPDPSAPGSSSGSPPTPAPSPADPGPTPIPAPPGSVGDPPAPAPPGPTEIPPVPAPGGPIDVPPPPPSELPHDAPEHGEL